MDAPTKSTSAPPPSADRIAAVVAQYWGFDSLRPLQAEAIQAALAPRDSLVVMPTGGGKSLCYQTPPAVDGSLDIVVSPLISLMKDQVDGLRGCGYPAGCLHSGMSAEERRDTEAALDRGELHLLFMAPERLVTPWFLQLAARHNVRRFAIDEAHCISHWGHDFRPEYRQLAILRERFPQATLHAFTATATPRVQHDIVAQLGLRDPAVLVGCFDRPNLVYRILPLMDREAQIIDVVRRHQGEATIIYCISRKDTETLAATLNRNGIQADHYHAGLDSGDRHRTQEAFSDERLDVIVATVAFGMGIDRSNVRCVIHAGMPKSIEHYQQETGRAGRDGLEAECVLLYSAADVMRWESLVRHSAEGADDPAPVIEAGMQLVRQMQRICNSPICRHKTLSEYFGQGYENPNCGACDVCLGEVESLDGGTVIAQKVLSCVARTGERFGIGHIVDVLQGADTERIRQCNHQKLSTYGLLKEMPKKQLQSIVYQLVDQGLLARSDSEYPTLALNDASWAVMRGQREVKLVRPKTETVAKTRSNIESWDGVDRGLFDHLRAWRKGVAAERAMPPFLVLDDHTLRDLARVRPIDERHLRGVHGIGAKRLADLGAALVETIGPYCREHGLTTNQTDAAPAVSARLAETPISKSKGATQEAAFLMFAQKRTIDEVATTCSRARSTVSEYLAEFISVKRPASIDAWVHPSVQQRVLAAAAEAESGRLKPIFEKLNGEVPYEEIRLVLAHLATLT